MALRDILVHIDESPYCGKRVKIAIKIAQSNDAELTALFAMADPGTPGSGLDLNKHQKLHEKRSAKAREKYQVLADEAEVKLNWHMARFPNDDDMVTDQVVHFTQHTDMVIVGQHDSETANGSVPADMPERLVLETGRPVLVIPYAGEFEEVGKRVVVAWNTGRESVRAVNDAIPLILDATRVKVIAINPKMKGKRHGYAPSSDIARHLERHGIAAEADHFSTAGVNEGELILNMVSDERADLLVMGAYGHHRFRELILGGVTQSIFERMTTPVLMSH